MNRLPPAYMGWCVRCGTRATNWHERLPRSRGGPRDAFNAVRLCGSGTTGCHGWVTANPDAAEREGLYVRGEITRGVYRGPDPEYAEHYRGASP